MPWRPLNKTLFIEVEEECVAFDVSQKVLDAINTGILVLPEKNTVMKISDHGRVIRAANDCRYPYKKGQRIRYDHKFDSPFWVYDPDDKKRYRAIKEWYIDLVYES